MRTVNITFQASTKGDELPWEMVPIVYVLKGVPSNYDVLLIADVISRVLGFVTVRTSRLFLDDEITPKIACRYNGGYYIAKNE